ncbi:helix-turn-helix domain-containing protein [Streptomyces sp. NPDC020951]|uniref:helix-turn-helix domain-containing protein n=1 Tax=Streptomyces sp. NPDC020951 TaxID=3365104 RepID=UPI0037BA899F
MTYPCRPGTLLWVRPGEVQRYVRPGGTNGLHLLFTPSFLPLCNTADRLLSEWRGPVCRQLGASSEYAVLATLVNQIRAEYDRCDHSVSPEMLRHLLAAVLLHIDRSSCTDERDEAQAGGEVYARFCAELERSYTTTRRAADYADRLGYTVRTLSRACLAATGQPVDRVIDERVALEAWRLLVHTDEPVSTIARHLGFPESTNFGKFFTRHTGTTPGAFREPFQSDGPHSMVGADRRCRRLTMASLSSTLPARSEGERVERDHD